MSYHDQLMQGGLGQLRPRENGKMIFKIESEFINTLRDLLELYYSNGAEKRAKLFAKQLLDSNWTLDELKGTCKHAMNTCDRSPSISQLKSIKGGLYAYQDQEKEASVFQSQYEAEEREHGSLLQEFDNRYPGKYLGFLKFWCELQWGESFTHELKLYGLKLTSFSKPALKDLMLANWDFNRLKKRVK